MVEYVDTTASERWHTLLNSRYVCEICLTRFFVPYHACPACHQVGCIRPLVSGLSMYARNEQELRDMIARGQTLPPVWPQEPEASAEA